MFEQLQSLLVNKFEYDKDQITLDTQLSTDLGLNSIELAELVVACEEEFEIEINDEDIHEFTTIRDVVEYLEKKTK
ncbi:MAG: acyl carrier protein [Clostridia bacterium]|nr:acyl carrier protein [Clostridia bacterium]